MRNTHCEDARISPAASVCVAFHHVADRVLKAWYSKVSKRENNQPLLPGVKQKHSAPAFCAKGQWEETGNHGNSSSSESYTWHTEAEV